MGHSVDSKSKLVSRPSVGLRRLDRPTIAILGGTGRTGQHLLRTAFRRGYAVRVLARDPMKVTANRNTSIIVGDATDAENIEQLVAGADVVISCVGPSRHNEGLFYERVSSAATEHLIRALSNKPSTRYVVVSQARVALPSDRYPPWVNFYEKYIAPKFHDNVLKDKLYESKLLLSSELEWTLVRCSAIVDEDAKSPIEVSDRPKRRRFVRAGELAEFLIDQIESKEHLRSGPFVSSAK